LPFFPTRSGVSARIGPLESHLIAEATIIIIGEKRISKSSERIISMALLQSVNID
jgi:hypothetical protein